MSKPDLLALIVESIVPWAVTIRIALHGGVMSYVMGNSLIAGYMKTIIGSTSTE